MPEEGAGAERPARFASRGAHARRVAFGSYLDQRDRQLAHQTASRALETAPSGTTSTWHNPDNGHSGSVTPLRTHQTAAGQYCREFTQTVSIGGRQQQSYGTACRQPDGSWRIGG